MNMKTLPSSLSEFLFKSQRLHSLGLMRLILGSVLLYLAVFRHFNMDQFMDGSIIPRDQALSMFPEFYKPWIQFFFWPDSLAPIVHLSLILLYFLMVLGLTSRPLMLLTWVIAQGFIQRNYSILFGADLIGNLLLFFLCFTNCTKTFSLRPLWTNFLHQNLEFTKHFSFSKILSHKWNDFFEDVSSVFYRLIQIQICVIYAYTGFEKLKGTSWWDGTALWTVLANPQFTNYDFIWLRHFPIVFALGTFITIIFEVYFPVMVYMKKTRGFWLLLGVLFHFGIGFLLGLMPFSLVMVSTYVLFLDVSKWSLNTSVILPLKSLLKK